MTRVWLRALGISLFLTLVIEILFALAAGKRGRALAVTALVNCLTNPPLVLTVLLFRYYGLPLLPAGILILEVLVILVEGMIYRNWEDFPHPWRFSIGANVISYSVGELLKLVLRSL